jgi:hypothetical protein
MKKSINDNGSLKNWKSAIENRQLKMGDVPILTCYLNLATSGADGVILIKQQWSQFSQ